MLRSFIEQPLVRKAEIEKRQAAVEELNMNFISREEIREYFKFCLRSGAAPGPYQL